MTEFPPEFHGSNVEVLTDESHRVDYFAMMVRMAKTRKEMHGVFASRNLDGGDLFLAAWGDWILEKLSSGA